MTIIEWILFACVIFHCLGTITYRDAPEFSHQVRNIAFCVLIIVILYTGVI